jgi:hypothetical protein
MRPLLLAVSLVLWGGGWLSGTSHDQPGATEPTTTVILVRHAERESGQGDDPISVRGRERAQTLALMLRDAPIRSIIT